MLIYLKVASDLVKIVLTSSFAFHYPDAELYFFADDEDVIKKCNEKWPDILIIDSRNFDYSELVKSIYDNNIIIPIICLTKQSNEERKFHLMRAGATNLLDIPYSDGQFISTVEKTLK